MMTSSQRASQQNKGGLCPVFLAVLAGAATEKERERKRERERAPKDWLSV